MKSPSSYERLLYDDDLEEIPLFYDTRDPDNFEAGLLNRINLKPRFKQTNMVFIDQAVDIVIKNVGLQPVPVKTRDEHRKYLEERPYPAYRRRQLIKLFDRIVDADFENFTFPTNVQTFIKDETYSKLKPPRLICARNDVAKTMLGPYFHDIDDKLFNSIYSVKHVPYLERPKIISQRFMKYSGWRYLVLDYTSFECSAGADAQMAIEYKYYKYMFPPAVFESIRKRLLARWTRLQGYDLGSARISPVRFSGEMNTSCGNTLYNLTAIIAAGLEQGIELQPLTEGDDSLTPIPPDFDLERFLNQLRLMGLIVKYEVHDYHGNCGYCSSYWDEFSALPRLDLREFLLNIQIAPTSTVRDLGVRRTFASKVLSYAIQYPHTPIVMDIAARLPDRHIVMKFNSYYYDELAALGPVSIRGRYMHSDVCLRESFTTRDITRFCLANGISIGNYRTAARYIREGRIQHAVNYLLRLISNDDILRENVNIHVARATRYVPSFKKKSFFSPCSPY